MQRKQEFEKVKEIIKENYDEYDCGIFDTRNLVGDCMMTIFKGKYFTIDACYFYSYYEVFGTTSEEFAKLRKYYIELGENKNE